MAAIHSAAFAIYAEVGRTAKIGLSAKYGSTMPTRRTHSQQLIREPETVTKLNAPSAFESAPTRLPASAM